MSGPKDEKAPVHRYGRRAILLGLGGLGAGALLAACSATEVSGASRKPANAGIVAPPAANQAAPIVAAIPVAPASVNSPPTAVPVATRVPVNPTTTPAVTTPTAMPGQPTMTPTVVGSPTPKPYDAARLVDRLGSAQTSYAGSIPERAHNVELATKRLDGTVVAPGAVFSFNKAVGATTVSAGYKIGYGITIKDDKPETIPSVAGGICQVATTVFQAAYWAGMQFVERHYHIYWIPRYGQPPSGRIGFDATVDDPGVDLKFKNPTGEWIRLNSWFDGTDVGFVIRGVDPKWTIESSRPRTSDYVKAETEMVFQDDPTMPNGQKLEVEHAEDGFKVSVIRLTKLGGKVVDEYAFTNVYRPSRNVTLVGVKGATPTPIVTPTSTVPMATPTPATVPVTRLENGRIIVPSLVGMSEAQARRVIDQAGLANTYTNYQGPGDVPPAVLGTVAVGSVLSQSPNPGTNVGAGTTVHLAVRRS
ncbi:MAG: PASTA domain-containing protein [Chloroflexota bacterium]|nr:MAG: PASTA domain-containing protein [Chloroflexota bacterium]